MAISTATLTLTQSRRRKNTFLPAKNLKQNIFPPTIFLPNRELLSPSKITLRQGPSSLFTDERTFDLLRR